MYQILVTPSARKEAKKLPKNARIAAVEAARSLQTNPYLGEKLSGSLHFLYSLHFKAGGKQYRLAYSIDEKHSLIIVHLIQIRGGFYDKLRRIFH
jgi:mRNA-degrading endonuclease RelE of RelBE toxin-antitoxin system